MCSFKFISDSINWLRVDSLLYTETLLTQLLQKLQLLGRKLSLRICALHHVREDIDDAEDSIIKNFSIMIINVLVVKNLVFTIWKVIFITIFII